MTKFEPPLDALLCPDHPHHKELTELKDKLVTMEIDREILESIGCN
jgi:hypothetical protein